MALNDNKLLDYACLKFQEDKYDEALEAFVLAYMKGLEPEWIIENIYNCYVKGNTDEFQSAFQRYEQKSGITFEDCILDFIPYRDGEYYIFDREENIFRGKFSVWDVRKTVKDPIFNDSEFSDAVLEMDWDFRAFQNVLVEAKNRKIYVVCQDCKRTASFYKIPELAEYMENIKLFSDWDKFQEYFHQNTEIYLPRLFIGNVCSEGEFKRIINAEHQYRLTPEGRNTDNVLLTIGIPTANRGHLVLKRLENLLKMPFDAEVEIAISKNGFNYYEEEYTKVSQMSDARICYYDHGKVLKPADNWIYTVEMAHGKYVLLVSDEDDVIIGVLEHYLRLISKSPDLSIMRAATIFQYTFTEKIYGKKGLEAFGNAFLFQNYLSGLIVRRKDFIEENFRKLHRFYDNAFYINYPHEWWCAFLTKKGDYIAEPIKLIIEHESLLEEETERLREQGLLEEGKTGLLKGTNFPAYATFEARLEQFLGYIDFIHFFMEGDIAVAERAIRIALFKTSYLFKLALSYHYEVEKFEHMLVKFTKYSINAIEEFDFNDEQKRNLFNFLERQKVQLIQFYENHNSKETGV